MNDSKLPETSGDEGLARGEDAERNAETTPAPSASDKWPDPSALPPARQHEVRGEPETKEKSAWEQITDHGWDRQILEFWLTGYTCEDIGKQLDLSPKTILNVISLLRKINGTDLVPMNKQRWERIRKIGMRKT